MEASIKMREKYPGMEASIKLREKYHGINLMTVPW